MNGEVKVYKKKDFYTWEELIDLPNDLQVKWANSLITRYGCSVDAISEIVFGKPIGSLRKHFEKICEGKYINKGIRGSGGMLGKQKLAEAFAVWKNTQITMSEEDLPHEDPAHEETVETVETSEDPAPVIEIEEKQPEIEALPETTAQPCEEVVTPAPQIALKQGDLYNIGALIQSLVGSGAKLTIEVTL